MHFHNRTLSTTLETKTVLRTGIPQVMGKHRSPIDSSTTVPHVLQLADLKASEVQ